MASTDGQNEQLQDTPDCGGRRLVMPSVVIGLLGGHVLFIAYAITLATADPSFAVVPDYYQRAVGFDERKAALQASEELGWHVELIPSASATDRGEREATVRITDADGLPVTGAAVRLDGYHISRAGDPQSFELAEVSPGQYTGSARLVREGFWEFDLVARRGETVYVTDLRQFLWAPTEHAE